MQGLAKSSLPLGVRGDALRFPISVLPLSARLGVSAFPEPGSEDAAESFALAFALNFALSFLPEDLPSAASSSLDLFFFFFFEGAEVPLCPEGPVEETHDESAARASIHTSLTACHSHRKHGEAI